MRVALFGGTFDPIHSGHVRAAKAAARKFRLDRILLVPCGHPPHKVENSLTPFAHRYAMTALAATEDSKFVPSLLEAPKAARKPNYSIDTVLTAKRLLKKSDELFFLIGVDAFREINQWKDFRRLLGSVDFIVLSRPGYSTTQIAETLSPDLFKSQSPRARPKMLRLKRTILYALEGLDEAIASRHIRQAIRAGRPVSGLVPRLVEEYILKEGLYRPGHHGPKK